MSRCDLTERRVAVQGAFAALLSSAAGGIVPADLRALLCQRYFSSTEDSKERGQYLCASMQLSQTVSSAKILWNLMVRLVICQSFY